MKIILTNHGLMNEKMGDHYLGTQFYSIDLNEERERKREKHKERERKRKK